MSLVMEIATYLANRVNSESPQSGLVVFSTFWTRPVLPSAPAVFIEDIVSLPMGTTIQVEDLETAWVCTRYSNTLFTVDFNWLTELPDLFAFDPADVKIQIGDPGLRNPRHPGSHVFDRRFRPDIHRVAACFTEVMK